jgi:hypothetical protein
MSTRIIVVCIICFSFLAPGFAQTKKQVEVESAVEKLRRAMLEADSSALAAIVSDDLSYGHSSGHI